MRLWKGWLPDNKPPRNANVIGRIGDWRPRPMRTPVGEHYEDLRLFVLGGQLAASGTHASDTGHLHGMAVLDLSGDRRHHSGPQHPHPEGRPEELGPVC